MKIVPDRTATLSHEELYLFDTMGHLRIPEFLSRQAVQDCRAEVLRLASRRMEGRGDKERFDDLASHSEALRGLSRSRTMLDCVEPLINQPLRLIESYALRREENSAFYLHNGNSEILRYGDGRAVRRNMSLHHTFHEGKLFCMFVKVLIYLSDIPAQEDGPFCYLQGSHKANLPWFREGELSSPALTRENFPSLEHVPVQAGDAVLLNEALLHGTLPKTSGGERLVMAFSYAPAFVTDWKEIDLRSTDVGKLGHY